MQFLRTLHTITSEYFFIVIVKQDLTFKGVCVGKRSENGTSSNDRILNYSGKILI